MTIDLYMVGATCFLLMALIMLQGASGTLMNGIGWGLSNRQTAAKDSPFYDRLSRTITNHIHAMLMFVPLVFILHMADLSTTMTMRATIIFVIARLAYAVVYVMGITFIRSLMWGVGFLSTLALLPALFGSG